MVEALLSGATLWELVSPADRLTAARELQARLDAQPAHFTLPALRLCHAQGELSVLIAERVSAAGQLVFSVTPISSGWEQNGALVRDRERLQLVLEGTRLGMWDWNPQTNEVTFDARWAEMLGHSLDEIEQALGSWSERVHPDDIEACFADIQRHMRGEVDFYENVHRMRHADGSWRHILDRGRIVEWDAAGQPVRFTGTHTDITAQKEAEERAREAAQAKGRFLATMSHEIRTPLHGILGILSVLEAGTESPERSRELLALMRSCGDTLLGIINDILDFSKIEAHSLRISPHTFSLREEFSAVCAVYQEQARARGLGMVVMIDESLPDEIYADALRIKQVLMNLIGNALKFTEDGKITVCLENDGGKLRLAVHDTGHGIADTAQIWGRFEQEDDTISRKHGGTGLGLNIVRELCRLMGGDVSVQSTVGVGSTFTATIPFEVHAQPQDAPDEAQPAPLRVLVVEDNAINQLILRTHLERFGSRCEIVQSGRQAIDAVRSGSYDLVFMDVHMPDMDGFTATQRLRALPGSPPFVCGLSADTTSGARERARAVGMDCYLSKPFHPQQLQQVLREVGQGPARSAG